MAWLLAPWGLYRLPLSILWAKWRFASQRADYYEFLAQNLQQSRSSRTLLDIFLQDHRRHGQRSARGRLSRWWSQRYLVLGGDLAQTWRLTLPATDLDCIGVAQQVGEPALIETLHALALQTRALRTSASDFWQAAAAGIVALLVACSCTVVMPLFTAPRLVASFSMVPPALYGPATRRLLDWSGLVGQHGWLGLLLLVVWLGFFVWSFANLTGRFRDWLDCVSPWSLYRDIQAMRFLVSSATQLNALMRQGISLRSVINTQQRYANRWVASHLARMTTRLDLGMDPLDALDTGLVSAVIWWQLVDVVRVHGLSDGLRLASVRLCDDISRSVRRRAQVLRWVLLIVSLVVVFLVGAWHAQVIEEMRQSLTFFYVQ